MSGRIPCRAAYTWICPIEIELIRIWNICVICHYKVIVCVRKPRYYLRFLLWIPPLIFLMDFGADFMHCNELNPWQIPISNRLCCWCRKSAACLYFAAVFPYIVLCCHLHCTCCGILLQIPQQKCSVWNQPYLCWLHSWSYLGRGYTYRFSVA